MKHVLVFIMEEVSNDRSIDTRGFDTFEFIRNESSKIVR